MMKPPRIAHFLIVTFLLLTPCIADDADKSTDEPKSASDKSPPTVKLSGVFEALNSSEVSVENEHLTSLAIERILPHGANVKKGQAVVWFRTKDLDKQMRDAEAEWKLAKLTMEADEFAYQQFLKTQEMDRAAAKRTRDHARADYDHFVKVSLPRRIASTKQSLKSSEFSVESTKEELSQLQQMYDEDDLTEQSEEIVLRRAKFSADSAEFRLEGTKISTNRTLNVEIPRSEISEKLSLDRALMTYDKAMHDLNNARRKQDIEIGRKRQKFKEHTEKYEKMRAERALVVIKAPQDGILLHGKLSRGKLPAKQPDWKKDSKVSANTVIATVVNPNKLVVRVDLPEANLDTIAKGKRCKINPTAFDEVSLNGVVRSVSAVPYIPGKYDCVVTVAGKGDSRIVPTMGCELVFTDSQDEEKKPAGKAAKKEGAAK